MTNQEYRDALAAIHRLSGQALGQLQDLLSYDAEFSDTAKSTRLTALLPVIGAMQLKLDSLPDHRSLARTRE